MKKAGKILVMVCATVGVAFGTVTFDDNVTPDAIFGSGNPNGLFTVDRAGAVELGLRAKIPFVGTINSNGDGTYSYSHAELSGFADHRWNWDWTVNTDFDGSTGAAIDDFTYVMRIDVDPSVGVSFSDFDPITPNTAPVNAPFWDHSIGNNGTANGGGTEAADAVTYAALIAGNNVAQNSWRHQFFGPHDGLIDGTYDIVLSAFSGGNQVASTSIRVIIGAGGGPACGNGILNPGEECDGAIAGNCASGICNPDCTCEPVAPVPTVSEWGLAIMVLVGLSAGTIMFSRKRALT